MRFHYGLVFYIQHFCVQCAVNLIRRHHFIYRKLWFASTNLDIAIKLLNTRWNILSVLGERKKYLYRHIQSIWEPTETSLRGIASQQKKSCKNLSNCFPFVRLLYEIVDVENVYYLYAAKHNVKSALSPPTNWMCAFVRSRSS